MANILITGANGKIATAIIDKKASENNLFLFSRDKAKLEEKYGHLENIHCYSNSEVDNFSIPIDIVLHCAFERSSDEARLIEAQKLSVKFFSLAKRCSCKRFINISSQAVYSGKTDIAPTEDTNPYPFDLYGILKLSTEKILEHTLDKDKYVHIRLTALSGGYYPAHILSKIVDSAIKTNKIDIKGSKLNFAFMDFRDAIEAFLILFDLNIEPKHNIYNLGNNQQYNIVEMAENVKKHLESHNIDVTINLKETENYLNAQLNSDRFMNEFSWKPKYSLDDTVKDLIQIRLGK